MSMVASHTLVQTCIDKLQYSYNIAVTSMRMPSNNNFNAVLRPV